MFKELGEAGEVTRVQGRGGGASRAGYLGAREVNREPTQVG